MSGYTGKMRDEVVLLVRDGDEYHFHGTLSLQYLNYIVPVVGDLITYQIEDSGIGLSRVDQRILVDMTATDAKDPTACCWTLVVSEVEDDRFQDLDMVMRAIRNADWTIPPVDLSDLASETVDDLDRDNRDPAYWTPDRKELLRKEREERLAAMKATKKS